MKTVSNALSQEILPKMLPVIPTMDVVVFPHMIVPLLVLDERIIEGINQALDQSKKVLLLAAKKHVSDSQGAIGTEDLYNIGTVATIMRMIRIPEGGIKILVQGVCKAETLELVADETTLSAEIKEVQFDYDNDSPELDAQVKNIKELAERMAASGQSFSPDFHVILSKIQDPTKIADFVLSHLSLSVERAQELLETTSQKDFLAEIYQQLTKEVEVAQVQERIKSNARESMNQSQKEYYLREQLKAIKKELGEDDVQELDVMREKLSKLNLSEEVTAEVKRQLNRLERMSGDSMEAAVTRNYIELIASLPWNIETEDNLDIKNAKNILDEDHHGLKEIKDRILDFISIRSLKQDSHTPILCFAGPPGTGKTSLGKSIARSLGRKFARISLGGVKDEAEIRGHRRTYVGAMPGRFIQAVKKAGSVNPIILIDEIDKLGADFRGDPSAAMLEVLDPAQNKTFYDNYLGVPFDISKVIFIATANNIDNVSAPLRDRMEVISLSGYDHEEKIQIAQRHLVPQSQADSGLKETVDLSSDVLKDIIINYTREAGIRQLERLIRKLFQKVARAYVETQKIITVTTANIENYLGPRKFIDEDINLTDMVGITNGLAWTSCGGEMIRIEAVLMPGKGRLMLTGQLGDVMKESAQAALSYARAHANDFGINASVFTQNDLHIHIPAGAVPKDGPSAGITMLSSILSALTNRPILSKYAMTGELNLRGDVMRIGGVKEKILAAKRNGVPHVIIPQKNKSDLVGLEDVVQDIEVIFVETADEVLKKVLQPTPTRKKSK